MSAKLCNSRRRDKKTTDEAINDCYYTNDDVANECVAWLPELPDDTLLVEPSAGGGAFVRALKKRWPAHFLDAVDLRPTDASVRQLDWFDWQVPDVPFWVVGNPPFYCEMDHKFFRHACNQGAALIAMILPRSWRREYTQNRVDRRYTLVQERLLPENAFHISGQTFNVRCVWQVWKRLPDSAPDRPLPPPVDYSEMASIVTGAQRTSAQLVVRRAGHRAGQFIWEASLHEKHLKSINFYYIVVKDVGFLNWLREKQFNVERHPMIYDSSSFPFINSGQILRSLDEQYGVYLCFYA